jgi:hypothetical protein
MQLHIRGSAMGMQNSPLQIVTVLAEPGENTLLLIRNEVTQLSWPRDSQVTSLHINTGIPAGVA